MPTISPGIGFAVVAAAVAFNFSLQGRIDSLVTLIGVTIVALMIAVQPDRRTPSVVAPALLAIAAAVITMLRASPWIVVPAVLVWISCLIVASQGGVFSGAGSSTVFGGYVGHLKDALVLVGRTIAGPQSRTRVILGSGPSGDPGKRNHVVRGLLGATVVIIPLTWLLASADAAFARLIGQVFQGNFFVHLIVIATVVPAVLATAVGALTPRAAASTAAPANGSAAYARSTATMVEGTIVLGAVAALLGTWGATQVIVALGGADRLLTTADLTAAANARQGFFQLVAATALLVLIIVAVDKFVVRSGQSEHRRFLILTSIIGLETVGVVIATYTRLALYIERFGNTMLRTSVAWFLAWLMIVMTVLILSVNNRSQRLHSTAGPIFVLACLWVIGFGLFNPEVYVARGNIERRDSAAAPVLDLDYLTQGLGTDAIPMIVDQLASLDPAARSELTEQLCSTSIPETGYGPLGYNRSASTARATLADLGCEAFMP